MTEEIDDRLGRLLRADSVPQRDALFRIRLLERGERQRYRRQAAVQRAVLVLLVAAPLILWWITPEALSRARAPVSQLLREALLVAFVLALVAAVGFSVRGILQAVRWMRGSPRF